MGMGTGRVVDGSPIAWMALARLGEIPGWLSRYCSSSCTVTPLPDVVTRGAGISPMISPGPAAAAAAATLWDASSPLPFDGASAFVAADWTRLRSAYTATNASLVVTCNVAPSRL